MERITSLSRSSDSSGQIHIHISVSRNFSCCQNIDKDDLPAHYVKGKKTKKQGTSLNRVEKG